MVIHLTFQCYTNRRGKKVITQHISVGKNNKKNLKIYRTGRELDGVMNDTRVARLHWNRISTCEKKKSERTPKLKSEIWRTFSSLRSFYTYELWCEADSEGVRLAS
uniref:Uncharacterized protein n=1 Tax=Cucumis melo TaxID=3656 RepID=A0A9I9ECL1_CUCME